MHNLVGFQAKIGIGKYEEKLFFNKRQSRHGAPNLRPIQIF